MQRGAELFADRLLLFLDAGRRDDPQTDPSRKIQLVGPRPMPLDGFVSWASLDRPVNLAWDLKPAEVMFDDGAVAFQPERTGTYRGLPARSVAPSSFVRPISTNGQLLPGPQLLSPPLRLTGNNVALTVAMWLWLPPRPVDEPPYSEAVNVGAAPILQLGGGCALALHVDGVGLTGTAERVEVPRGRWTQLFLVSPGAGAACSILGAWDPVGIRQLGSLGSLPADATLESLGGQELPGAGFLSQVAVWGHVLEVEKMRAIFAADGVHFGCMVDSQVDAVRAGFLPSRTSQQDAEFTRRLDLARCGGEPGGIINFSQSSFLGGLWVRDEDIPSIFEALAEGSVAEINLSGAMVSAEGIRLLMSELRKNPYQVRRVNLSDCEAIRGMGSILITEFPIEKGLSLEVGGSGLSESETALLQNRTLRADEILSVTALRRQEVDARCVQYGSMQQSLEESAEEDRNALAAPATPAPLHSFKKWPKGNDKQARLAYRAFLKSNPEGLVQKEVEDSAAVWAYTDKNGQPRSVTNDQFEAVSKDAERQVARAGQKWFADGEAQEEEGEAVAKGNWLMDEFGSRKNYLGFRLWNGAKPAEPDIETAKRRRLEWELLWQIRQEQQRELSQAAIQMYDSAVDKENVASGQLVAHLTYLRRNGDLTPGAGLIRCDLERHDSFGLKWNQEQPKSQPSRGVDIHDAIAAGRLRLVSAVGNGFGKNALQVELSNLTPGDLEIKVPQGTIFQHRGWEQRQNLIVSIDYLLKCPAGGSVSKKMLAYCMNLTCPAPKESPMTLTEFYVDDLGVVEDQGTVWDYFESCTAGS